jgi:hypothetical protein
LIANGHEIGVVITALIVRNGEVWRGLTISDNPLILGSLGIFLLIVLRFGEIAAGYNPNNQNEEGRK